MVQDSCDKALHYYSCALKISEEIGNKIESAVIHHNIGVVNWNKCIYKEAEKYIVKSISIQNEIGYGGILPLWSITYLYLIYKKIGKKYDEKEIHNLIKEAEFIEFELNFPIYQLLEDTSYLETAYNQVQEKADNLEPDVKAKFLSYPIPKAIVEEWGKETLVKN